MCGYQLHESITVMLWRVYLSWFSLIVSFSATHFLTVATLNLTTKHLSSFQFHFKRKRNLNIHKTMYSWEICSSGDLNCTNKKIYWIFFFLFMSREGLGNGERNEFKKFTSSDEWMVQLYRHSHKTISINQAIYGCFPFYSNFNIK